MASGMCARSGILIAIYGAFLREASDFDNHGSRDAISVSQNALIITPKT